MHFSIYSYLNITLRSDCWIILFANIKGNNGYGQILYMNYIRYKLLSNLLKDEV